MDERPESSIDARARTSTCGAGGRDEPHSQSDDSVVSLVASPAIRGWPRRGQSLGELARQACERQCDFAYREERLAAVEAPAAMRLPVRPVEQIITESVRIVDRARDLLNRDAQVKARGALHAAVV